MFREVRSRNTVISREKCIEVLRTSMRGVLSLEGEDGYPYGIPMNYWYDEENDRIIFHGARIGFKYQILMRNNKVSFCVWDEGFRREGEWALNINSVIVFGRINIIDDVETVTDLTRKLSAKYTDDTEFVEDTINKYVHFTIVMELVPEHMTGRLVNES